MVLWFGIGEGSKIAFIAYAAFFPIFTTTVEGMKFVDPVLPPRRKQPGRHAAGPVPLQWCCPPPCPSIITRAAARLRAVVLRHCRGRIHRRRIGGLGYLINDARTFFLVSQMLLGAAVIGIIGFLFNVALRRLEARLLRWRRPARA